MRRVLNTVPDPESFGEELFFTLNCCMCLRTLSINL